MLRLGIKIGGVLILLCTLFTCKNNLNTAVRDKRILYKAHSIKQIGNKAYLNVWNAARDSVKTYIDNHLVRFTTYNNHVWYLDSLVSFNKKADRCVMALSYQDNPSSPSDCMEYLYGAKINGKWYFFLGGGQFVLPRDYYQTNVRVPLNIEQFNDIATDNIFNGYLKKDAAGKWEINDAFFVAHFEDVGWGDFERYQDTVVHGKRFDNKKEYFENIYMGVVKGNWIRE